MKSGNGSNGRGNGNGRRPAGRSKEKLYILERRKVVADLRLFSGASFQDIADKLPSLGFRKVCRDTAWDDFQAYTRQIREALETTEMAGELLAKFDGVYKLALKGYADAKSTDKNNPALLVTDPQGQAALLGRALDALRDLAEMAGLKKPPELLHKHSGSLNLIDELARAEREAGREKVPPGLRGRIR